METQIVVALVTGGFALVGVLGAPYVVARQAKDLRVVIEREIDIARKLTPGSEDADLLERHISASIRRLVRRDEAREAFRNDLRPAAQMVVATLLVVGAVLARNKVPDSWDMVADVVIWCLYAVFAVAVLRVWRFIYRSFKPAVVNAGRITLYGWYKTQAAYFSARLSWVRRRNSKLVRRAEESVSSYREVRQRDADMRDLFFANKEQLIAENGQTWWDDMVARRQELDEVIVELDEEFEPIEAKLREVSSSDPDSPDREETPPSLG